MADFVSVCWFVCDLYYSQIWINFIKCFREVILATGNNRLHDYISEENILD